MVANYLSVVHDLTGFGIFKIRNAMVSADMDENITIEVSFNGGKTFQTAKVNEKFSVVKSTGKVQVRITFEDVTSGDIYKVKVSGFFQNLDIGTTVKFTKNSNNNTYTTKLGRNGQYNISLPRGLYDVWYTNKGVDEPLMVGYNPEIQPIENHRIDKEAVIEGIFRDIPWAKYSVFDTFVDKNKMLNGSAIIDTDGDLSDGNTYRKCRYWAIGFD